MFSKIKDLMIPVEDYPVLDQDQPIKEAVLSMRQIYCQAELGKCTESGHRNVLIKNEDGSIVGILDFWNVLIVLIPEAVGGISKALEEMNVTLAFAEAEETPPREDLGDFKVRVLQNAEVPCQKIMTGIKRALQSEDSLLQGLKELHSQKVSILPVYEDARPVGVIRDTDLFLTAVSVIAE